MQFIEKNSFNVRSAIYRLKREDTGLEFILFSMIHVGSKEFYGEVSQRLAECDLVLAEGVKSKKVNLLTRSYRIVKRIRRMNLVTQQEGMEVSSFREKIVNADMEGDAFDEGWSLLPSSLKLQLFFMMPVYVVYLFYSVLEKRLPKILPWKICLRLRRFYSRTIILMSWMLL